MSIHNFFSLDGASGALYADGAHVTSWVPVGTQGVPGGEREQLFLSSRSAFGPGASIRGGIPVIFPQFSDQGPLPKHGFARRLPWRLLEAQPGVLCFGLEDSAETRAIWPHAFTCRLEARLEGKTLNVALWVENRDRCPFTFTAALHTYLRVAEVSAVRLIGLEGAAYTDSANGNRAERQAPVPLVFSGEVDRVYPAAPAVLRLEEGARILEISQGGFQDTVVWNPGPLKGAALGDLEPEGWRRFVCVEAAQIQQPIELSPGEIWSGWQRLTLREG